jgi:Flp pilus assembly pilin Flp
MSTIGTTSVLRAAIAVLVRLQRLTRRRDDDGQATAEYALVLLGAAAVALLVVSWATKTNVVGRLLDVVFGHLTSRATSKAG